MDKTMSEQDNPGTTSERSAASGAVGSVQFSPRTIKPAGAFADPEIRAQYAAKLREEGKRAQEEGLMRAQAEGWDPSVETDGPGSKFMGFRDGRPIVYETHNQNAGISSAAAEIRGIAPYSLSGAGEKVGIWDQGHALQTHQELRGRVYVMDGIPSLSDHGTHVIGTVGASGVVAAAIGMAPQVSLESYEWTTDFAEMSEAGMAAPGETNNIQISNHSYGPSCGWNNAVYPPKWYGTWGNQESDVFGSYQTDSANLDNMCWDMPYYLPFVSPGNERGDYAPANGAQFKYYSNGWVLANYDSAVHPPADNWDNGGYDTIGYRASAKNVLSVGSVNDAVSGGNRSVAVATMTSYSSWGPTDDGRIKPDLVANGAGVYSCGSASDSNYQTMDGVSMALASASGSAILLVEYYNRLFPGSRMRASSIKALLAHTADDLETPGPDYKTGWGLINVHTAADVLKGQSMHSELPWFRESSLGGTNITASYVFAWSNSGPIKATLCWTDPAGVPHYVLDDPTPVLVNDLDLRIITPSGVTNMPFVLDRTQPANAATTGDNNVDNIEQVLFAPSEPGIYTAVVSIHGSLSSATQHFSLVISGFTVLPEIQHTPLENTTNNVSPRDVDAQIVSLHGLAANSPVVLWKTNGASEFITNVMSTVTNNLYRGQIPAMPLGTVVSYSLRVSTTNGLTTVAPADGGVYTYETREPVTLVITGAPPEAGAGYTIPAYGSHVWPSGAVVTVQAAAFSAASNSHRWRCSGWTGSGSVPATGTSSFAGFVLSNVSSVITWQWAGQYALSQTSSVPGAVHTQTWWDVSSTGMTIEAPDSIAVATETYRFAGWFVDGNRQPDNTNSAVNPATSLAMNTSRVASADYILSSLDSDADSLPDWWEQLFFGSAGAVSGADADGDTYSNIVEFLDGTDPRNNASVPAPPVISHLPLPAVASSPAPWVISATVTDNCYVASVTLHWRRNGLEPEYDSSMTNNGSPGGYSGIIAGPGTNSDTFSYRITAVDRAGFSSQDGPHEFYVSYPDLRMTPTNMATVSLPWGGTTNTTVILTNIGLAALQWTATVVAVGFNDDCESGTNGWTHGGQYDSWHLSTNRSVSGAYSWYCGRTSFRTYVDSMDASLVTPPVILGAGARLRYRQWIATELDATNRAWDGATVGISANGGATFTDIAPVGGYPFVVVSNPASCFLPDTPILAGTGGWQNVVFDLSSYERQEVRLRFRFGSDAYVVDEGWYLDDIRVLPRSMTDTWITLVPSSGATAPSNGASITVFFNSSNVPPGSTAASAILLTCNDPVTPASLIPVVLETRTAPFVTIQSAAQVSTNGTGLVNIMNSVVDLDGDRCALALEISTNGGATWNSAWMSAVTGSIGSVSFSNGLSPNIYGVMASDDDEPVTNRVLAVWQTTNGPAPVLQCADTLARARAWDGEYWSMYSTSAVFLVDNAAPLPSGAVVSIATSQSGDYVIGNVFTGTWSAFEDSGSGVAGYYYGLSDGGTTTNGSATQFRTGVVATAVSDATNILYVWARDGFGNIGASASGSVLALSPSGDWDNDGMRNIDEETAGTDARNTASLLAVNDGRVAFVTNAVYYVIRWQSVAGRKYSVQLTDDLVSPWNYDGAFSNIPGTGEAMVYSNSTDGRVRYFRVRAGPQ